MTWEEKHAQAQRFFQEGRKEQALALLCEVLSEKESSEIWSDWAAIQFSLGQYDEAEAGFRIALDIDNENIQSALNLGLLLNRRNRHEEAATFLKLSLKTANPKEKAAIEQLLLQHPSPEKIWNDPAKMEGFLRQFLSDDENECSYFETHAHRYVETLRQLPDGNGSGKLLELGAAFHHITPALKHCKGYGAVRCSDIWEGELQETRHIASNSGDEKYSFVVDNFDVQHHPWPYKDQEFDAVLCSEMLEHLHTDPMGLFAEINRILKTNGMLLLTTPNLASAYAVEETLRGSSPYCYGKFELGGKPTDRHNREYTAGEVERLATAAGFTAILVRTPSFYFPPKREILRNLAVAGHPIARRGDSTFLLARKQSAVKNRYPEEFYASVGVQAARRTQQSGEAENAPGEVITPPQNILLVHEILPHYDCSGADLRLYELVRELRSEGHRVTFLARDDRNDSRYGPPLEAMGATVYAGDPERLRHTGYDNPSTWNLQDVLRGGNFSIAILSHWFWCGISVAEHYMEEIRKYSPRTRVLVLSEDRHGERERRAAQLTGFLSDLERGNGFEQREAEIYQRADLVLYVTETDQQRFLELVPGLATEHLPTIAEAGPSGPGYSERDGVLFLGNFENLANRDALEWMLNKVWPAIRKAVPDLRLSIAGYVAPEGLEAKYPGVISLGKVNELGPLFAKHRVFAAPIRFGTGIITKNMHSLAHGLPVVTTTVGAEGMQLQHEKHALISDNPEEFATHILRLYRDQKLWEAIATEGRNYIRTKFCLENLRAQIRKIVAKTMRIRPRRHDPNYVWSYREVEAGFPEVLTQEPAHYRPMLRTLGYWQLGRQHLDAGRPEKALEQLRHIFTFVRGNLPASVFHSTLLDDMARCYRQLQNENMAARCEKEKEQLIWTWEIKAPTESSKTKQKEEAHSAPEISVVLPTYNREAILRVCLAALSFQSLPAHRWEAVVVDDGSTDNTETICRNHAFPFRMKYLRQENQGAGAARRAGVEAAQGEILLLCNDDTIASSNLLTEHLNVHRKNPHEKWAVLGEFRYSEGVGKRALSLFVNTSVFFFPQGTLKAGQLCDQAYFVTCNLSVPRHAVKAAGNFDPQFRVAEDTELGTRLVQQGWRVMYHPPAKAWHEHAIFTTKDLIRRAKAYGTADWDLFAKHPHLLGSGTGPFGLLTETDKDRMKEQLKQYRSAVESGIVALEALDEVDFRLLFKDEVNGPRAAKELIDQIGRLVPMIYWHYLFESFLERWEETPSKESSVAEIIQAI